MADVHLDWRGREVARDLGEAVTRAVQAGAELIRDEAVERTPVETGTLQGTAKVTVADGEAAVSYNTKYAARQHEEVGWKHTTGEAKYLENAATARRADVINLIKREIGKAL